MKDIGIEGVIRGKKPKTTIAPSRQIALQSPAGQWTRRCLVRWTG